MNLDTIIREHKYQFQSVKQVLNYASEPKSGDRLAGISANSKEERIAAKKVLSQLTIKDLRENPSVPYEEDFVTRIIENDISEDIYEIWKDKTLGELREWLLLEETKSEEILNVSKALTSEAISGVSKLMSNLDLVYVSSKIHIQATCNTTIGGENVLACRLQPNHPLDDPKGVLASVLEGLSYGAGDAVLGLNPAIDSVESTMAIWEILNEVKEIYEIPTQTCVLSHVTTQMEGIRRGGKADLCFQSIAGSQAACEAFGINDDLLEQAKQLFLTKGSAKGPNVMYFETGQGSELSSSAHFQTDQVTMECRCYGLARHYDPFLVNTVVGFMGPEYIYDTKELTRASLEDVFNGHMHGLPMGCDICYTNHMPVDQNDVETLLVLLASAGCHFVMGLPQGDDIMLMYQSTGFHDVATVRNVVHKQPIYEFQQWLEHWGFLENGHSGPNMGNPKVLNKKRKYAKDLVEYTPARINIGHCGTRYTTQAALDFMADQAAASDAVFNEVKQDVLDSLEVFEIQTKCKNKNEMILRPDWGRIIEEDQQKILLEKCKINPKVQIYFGDGLCSPSIGANVSNLFPALKQGLEYEGISVGTPFFVRYCRVNTARVIGPLLGAEVVCVLIGERPGLITSESMSAYIAYRPHPDMLESEYTVISNISRHGITPVEAGAHMVQVICNILEQKKSGVSIKEEE